MRGTELLGALTDLVLPRRCVGCGAVPGAGPGDPAGVAALCGTCRPSGSPRAIRAGPVDVRAAGDYDDGLRRALLAYKERGRRDLTGALAALLAVAIDEVLAEARAGLPRPVLVAPPSARAVAAARGGDHVLRGAWAGRHCRVRACPGVLRPTRAVRDSAGLGRADRARNLHGAMRACRADGRTAVLVDDIVTTGATLREAWRALDAAGWRVRAPRWWRRLRGVFPAAPLAAARWTSSVNQTTRNRGGLAPDEVTLVLARLRATS